MSGPGASADRLLRLVLIAVGMAVLAVLVFRLADVVLMAFGAVLVAILLDAATRPVQRLAKLPRAAALTLAVCAVTLCLMLVLWLFGSQAAAQAATLSDLLPRAWRNLRLNLEVQPAGRVLLAGLENSHPETWLLGLGPKAMRSVAAAATGSIIVAFAGLYMAAHPGSYLQGVLSLIPPAHRTRWAGILAECHGALRQWLIGQFISVVIVTATVALGLWLAGVPSPIALGMIAGIGQFVPVVGPMAATLPGLLAAGAMGWDSLGWAVVIYLAASQLEANLLTPLILRRMVQLPMAVTLFAVLGSGVLLGPLGVLFATPLAVAAQVLLNRTYVDAIALRQIGPG